MSYQRQKALARLYQMVIGRKAVMCLDQRDLTKVDHGSVQFSSRKYSGEDPDDFFDLSSNSGATDIDEDVCLTDDNSLISFSGSDDHRRSARLSRLQSPRSTAVNDGNIQNQDVNRYVTGTTTIRPIRTCRRIVNRPIARNGTTVHNSRMIKSDVGV